MLESYTFIYLIPILSLLVTVAWTIFLIVMILKFNSRDERKVKLMEELVSQNTVMYQQIDDLSQRVKELENRG